MTGTPLWYVVLTCNNVSGPELIVNDRSASNMVLGHAGSSTRRRYHRQVERYSAR